MDDSLEPSRWQRATAAVAAVCVASLLCAAVLTLFDDAPLVAWLAPASAGAPMAAVPCEPRSSANVRLACAKAVGAPGRAHAASLATDGG